jgi:hypothetical protein
MPLTPYETIVATILLPLVVAQIWNSLLGHPRLVSRVENLEVRRTEDRIQVDANTQLMELMRINIAESNIKFLNLLRQCEEDRVLNRLMSQDWMKNQKELSETVTELRTTLTMINQTLRHTSSRRARREEE